ncbi:MAG: polymerase [Herbinix sp.]|jgi:DNA polymerase III epsilon subunit-like protein|nr:polymerase [Herbinix sp.]
MLACEYAIGADDHEAEGAKCMHYIVFDLEFNQDPTSLNISADKVSICPFEIIQIGAIKLDSKWNAVATFNRYIKPVIYLKINEFVSELTGITTEKLMSEKEFPLILNDLIQFMGDDCVLCTWGMTDTKELYRNALFHRCDLGRLPDKVINLQPYVSIHLKQSPTIQDELINQFTCHKLMNLKAAVEALSIPVSYPFHNALFDAYYTAQLLKKLSGTELLPEQYNPNFRRERSVQPKQVVDYEGLLQQFTKMYHRELTKEQKDMITLAYKMGRTHQFVTMTDI